MSAYRSNTLARSHYPSFPLTTDASYAQPSSADQPPAMWRRNGNQPSSWDAFDKRRYCSCDPTRGHRIWVASAVRDILGCLQFRTLALVAPEIAARRGAEWMYSTHQNPVLLPTKWALWRGRNSACSR